MPVFVKKYIEKITCLDCNWSKEIKKGGYGDLVKHPISAVRVKRDFENSIESCPVCGSKKLKSQFKRSILP